MSEHAESPEIPKTFMDFVNYILDHKEDPEYEPNALLDVYVNFIEPFAAENDIELPEELNQLVETICEIEDEEDEEDEEDDDEESDDSQITE